MAISDERVLQGLGVSAPEESVYRSLLAKPGQTLAEIKEDSGLGASIVRSSTLGLESKGLVTRSGDRPLRFRVTAPHLALQGLTRRRHQELEQAAAAAEELVGALHRPTPEGPADLVDVVIGTEAVAQQMFGLMYHADEEVRILSKRPYVVAMGGHATELGRENLARGVKYRVIYDHSAFDDPFQIETITEDIELGQVARVLPEVPMKLVISDERMAITSLSLKEPDVGTALLIRTSSLLDAMIVLFETLWDKAVPFDPRVPSSDPSRPDISKEDRTLLALLMAGMTDDAVATRFGVSSRSVRRRVTRLIDEAGVQNRFQLAAEACWRDWITPR